MPGPAPKPAAVRQRRNKSASRTTLTVSEDERILKKPYKPKCPNEPGTWHVMAEKWWDDVWSSSMCGEYLRADLPALYRLLSLVDRYWKKGSMEVAREIRLMEREFGLTPLARRRLEWTTVQTEESKARFNERAVRRAKTVDGELASDPRSVLGD